MIVCGRWHRTTPATRAGYRALQACAAAPSAQTRWLRHILTVLKRCLNCCLTMSCHDRSAEVRTRVCCQVVAGCCPFAAMGTRAGPCVWPLGGATIPGTTHLCGSSSTAEFDPLRQDPAGQTWMDVTSSPPGARPDKPWG